VDELTRAAIRAWLADLSDTLEANTVKTRYRGLYRFCQWLVDEQEIDTTRWAKLSPPTPTPKPRPVPVLTDADLTALLKACQGKGFNERRDEAIVRLLLDCGLRVSELCGLLVDTVDLDAGSAVVLGTGNKVRAVYFGARTARALDRYLRVRLGHRWAHLDALFLTQRGAPSTDGPREMLNVRTGKAGLAHIHPHQFRHTFAHDFLVSGGQERDLNGWQAGRPA
jgi:site-specific recombinase XerC